MESWEAYAPFVARTFDHKEEFITAVTHATLGIIGEVGEVAHLVLAHKHIHAHQVKDEVGDVLFYIQGLYSTIDRSLYNDIQLVSWSERNGVIDVARVLAQAAVSLLQVACALADVVKKMVRGYGTGAELQRLATAVLYQLVTLASLTGFTLEDARDANIKKLTARFPDGVFTPKAAQEKADEK